MEKHMQKMWNHKKQPEWENKGFCSLGLKDLSQYALFSFMIMALTISKLIWLRDSLKNIGQLYNTLRVGTVCIIRFIVLTFF